MFVYELSGCGFEPSCSHLNFRISPWFKQGVSPYSGINKVWIHSETWTWYYMNIKSIFLPLALSSTLPLILLIPAADKTQYFVYVSFNSTFHLVNGISTDLRKLLKCFNGTEVVAHFRIQLTALSAWAAVFPNNLVFYLKDLKLS